MLVPAKTPTAFHRKTKGAEENSPQRPLRLSASALKPAQNRMVYCNTGSIASWSMVSIFCVRLL